jgi:hypothetical protein
MIRSLREELAFAHVGELVERVIVDDVHGSHVDDGSGMPYVMFIQSSLLGCETVERASPPCA